MILSRIALISAFICAQSVFSSTGIERKLFTMEKSYNPQNIMIIHTKTDDQCKFIAKNNEYVDFYWLMDRKSRKEVHSMIRGEIKEKVKFLGINKSSDTFKIRLADLSQLKHDLEDTTMEITSEINNGGCRVKSILKLGATGNYRKLNLMRTYCEVTTNLFGIPNGCKFIDLIGNDADSGEALRVRFKAK